MFGSRRPSATAKDKKYTPQDSNNAAQRSGLNTAQVESLVKVAIESRKYIGVRLANPVTNLTEVFAAMLGQTSLFKPMANKEKSASTGGAMLPQSLPTTGGDEDDGDYDEEADIGAAAAAAASAFAARSSGARPMAEWSHESELEDNFNKQKAGDLSYKPTYVSLDIMRFLMAINRLKTPTLRCETVTIINSRAPSQRQTETYYYLEFLFHETFQSSKTSLMRVRIPSKWVHRDLARSRGRVLKLEATIWTDVYEHRIKELGQLQNYFKKLVAGGISIDGSLSQKTPPPLYDIHKHGLFDKKGDFRSLSGVDQWRKEFDRWTAFTRLLDSGLFTSCPSATPRALPVELDPTVTTHAPEESGYLREKIQSAWLPFCVPPDKADQAAITLPWSAQSGFKDLVINRKPVKGFMASDVDMGFFSLNRRPPSEELEVVDLAAHSEGRVTGLGLREDALTITAINGQFLRTLPEYTGKDVMGQMLTKQFIAGIITAHHGAEYLNPYANADSVKETFDEGFVIVAPDGSMKFFHGISSIFAAFVEIVGDGHFIPMSTVWYDAFARHAVEEGKAVPDGFIAVDVAHDAKVSKKSTKQELEKAKRDKALAEITVGIVFGFSRATIDGALPEEHGQPTVLVQGPIALTQFVLEQATKRTVTLPESYCHIVMDTIAALHSGVEAATVAKVRSSESAKAIMLDGVVFHEAFKLREIRRDSDSSHRARSASAASTASSVAEDMGGTVGIDEAAAEAGEASMDAAAEEDVATPLTIELLHHAIRLLSDEEQAELGAQLEVCADIVYGDGDVISSYSPMDGFDENSIRGLVIGWLIFKYYEKISEIRNKIEQGDYAGAAVSDDEPDIDTFNRTLDEVVTLECDDDGKIVNFAYGEGYSHNSVEELFSNWLVYVSNSAVDADGAEEEAEAEAETGGDVTTPTSNAAVFAPSDPVALTGEHEDHKAHFIEC